jgi:hypothetical protein
MSNKWGGGYEKRCEEEEEEGSGVFREVALEKKKSRGLGKKA